MLIQVLGSGCRNCELTLTNVKEAVTETGIEATVEKVSDYFAMVKLGVTCTPAIVIDGKVVFSGGVPDKESIRSWLRK